MEYVVLLCRVTGFFTGLVLRANDEVVRVIVALAKAADAVEDQAVEPCM